MFICNFLLPVRCKNSKPHLNCVQTSKPVQTIQQLVYSELYSNFFYKCGHTKVTAFISGNSRRVYACWLLYANRITPIFSPRTFHPQVVQEYERAVIFRLGRLLQGGSKGPGMQFTYGHFPLCFLTYTSCSNSHDLLRFEPKFFFLPIFQQL